jgi:putative ABC transport system ATP-binding protein
MEAITAVDVNKYFSKNGNKFQILKNVNLHIEWGDFTAITGSSQNDRTALLRLFCGIEKPDEGKIFFCGVDTKDLSKWQRRTISHELIETIFKNEKINPFVSILRNISAPLISKGEKHIVANKKSYTILDDFGINELWSKKLGKLSEEQKQMVIIARAIVKDPQIIIADELTSYLNNENRRKIIHILNNLNKTRNTTIIISISDNLILEYAKKVIFLNDWTIDMERYRNMEIEK